MKFGMLAPYTNPMKFGQLILRKIFRIVAIIICQILRLKCTKNRFWLELRPRPRWVAYSASPDSLAGIKGTYKRGRMQERGTEEGGEKEEGMRREEGRGGKGRKRGDTPYQS